MENLKVIREENADSAICYIAMEKSAAEKLANETAGFIPVDEQAASNILTEYTAFVQYGAKDTPSYIFTKGNDSDWFIAQVEIKEENIKNLHTGS